MRKSYLLAAILLAGTNTMSPMVNLVNSTQHESVISRVQAKSIQPSASLGATLSENDIKRTLQLLTGQTIEQKNQYLIDGEIINHYLNDGSTRITPVYSSAVIEPREPGYGVQVQIVTPQTILNVNSQTYANAAITAGAEDVLIRIASLYPVTGEGALAGVYKMYEAAGQALNPQNVTTAQNEIKTVIQVKETKELTESQINEIQALLKTSLHQYLGEGNDTSQAALDQLIQQTIENWAKEHQLTLSQTVIQLLTTYAREYAQSEAAQNARTEKQIDANSSTKWTAEQAIDLFEGVFLYHTNQYAKIDPNQYDRKAWSVIDNHDQTITLSLQGVGKYEFTYRDHQVIITAYTDTQSPEKATAMYTIDKVSYLILHEKHFDLLDSKEGFDSFTEETAFDYLQKAVVGSNNDLIQSWIEPVEDGSYLVELVYQTKDNQDDTTNYGLFSVQPDGLITEVNNYAHVMGHPYYNDDLHSNSILKHLAWTSEKQQALEQFMIRWQAEMGQEYIAATPNNPANMYGITFPEQLTEGLLAVNDQKVAATWNPNGELLPDTYNIVAAYYQVNGPEMAGHFYLMTIYNGQSVVLHSQQNQGLPDGLVHFTPTENIALANAFTDIANNRFTTTNVVGYRPTTPNEETSIEPISPSEIEQYPNTEDPVWDAVKDEQMKGYFGSYEVETGEQYIQATPASQQSMYGVDFPTGVIERLAVSDQQVPARWANFDEPLKADVYNIVAAYRQTPPENLEYFPHFYLLAIYNGEPVVLHSQQNQGAEDGLIHFEPTQTEYLRQQFEATYQATPPTDDDSNDSAQIPWNNEKTEQLNTFMTEWQKDMNQEYLPASPENPANMYGVEFPAQITDDFLAVADQPVQSVWNPDGPLVQDTYNIVASYYQINGPSMQTHFYLMTIYNGEPIVLHSQQNQGMPDQKIHFEPTQNAALQEGFRNIYLQ